MAYNREQRPQPVPVATVEQARRRNAELRREFAVLSQENHHLEAQVGAMRLRVSEARKKLTRQVRELEAARTQAAQLAALPRPGALPEPVHGGPEGLKAAADEIDAHEAQGVMYYKPRIRKGPSHGTRDRYGMGCRCDACLGWRRMRTERESARQRQARAARKQAA